jgi:hypothetical protein
MLVNINATWAGRRSADDKPGELSRARVILSKTQFSQVTLNLPMNLPSDFEKCWICILSTPTLTAAKS